MTKQQAENFCVQLFELKNGGAAYGTLLGMYEDLLFHQKYAQLGCPWAKQPYEVEGKLYIANIFKDIAAALERDKD